MNAWAERSREERALLNPAFCSLLIWQAAVARTTSISPLSIEECYVLLALVLPSTTRFMLPRDTRTSLATWLAENPTELYRLPSRAKALVPFTRAALIFGGQHGILEFNVNGINPNKSISKDVSATLKDASDEVRSCAKKADFLGKWFAAAGPSKTVMALLGVRP